MPSAFEMFFGGSDFGAKGINRGDVETEVEEEVGTPSDDSQTIYDLLAKKDIDTLTLAADSCIDRVKSRLDTPVSHSKTPAWSLGGHLGDEGGTEIPAGFRTGKSGGGSAVPGENDFQMSTDGTANENAFMSTARRTLHATAGAYVALIAWDTGQAIANLSHDFVIGFTGARNSGDNNIAAFVPSAGDNTSGNVRVDAGGADTDGTLDYPTINGEVHLYAIVIDYADAETRFYVDADPVSATPDVTLAATPNDIPQAGARIEDTSGTGSDGGEALKVSSCIERWYPQGL